MQYRDVACNYKTMETTSKSTPFLHNIPILCHAHASLPLGTDLPSVHSVANGDYQVFDPSFLPGGAGA